MSLEQVERDVNTPPSLINLIVKEGHYFFSTLLAAVKGLYRSYRINNGIWVPLFILQVPLCILHSL